MAAKEKRDIAYLWDRTFKPNTLLIIEYTSISDLIYQLNNHVEKEEKIKIKNTKQQKDI